MAADPEFVQRFFEIILRYYGAIGEWLYRAGDGKSG